MPFTQYVPALENLTRQDPDPRRSVATHSLLPFQVNVTSPAGVPTRDLTVADSLTVCRTNARDGVADTVVVVPCLAITWVDEVAALAGRAHSAQVAVATAVTDTSRTSLMQIPPHITG